MKILKDSIVALVTPFNSKLQLDEKAFENLIKFHLKEGTKGIVISGTTGESATLTKEEKLHLLALALDIVKRNNASIPIIFNSGSNNTYDSIDLSKKAQEIGADWLLTVCPYYNKPSQNGLYKHFKAIAESVSLPICLYNVPSRTSVNLEVNTIAKLSKLNNIKAIKDATPELNRPLEISLKVDNNQSFTQLSGEDATVLSYLTNGGKGCISVSANVVPKKCQKTFDLWNSNLQNEALENHLKLLNLHNVMFVESNPVPAKYALSVMGMCDNYVRLPLTELSKDSQSIVKEELLKVINI